MIRMLEEISNNLARLPGEAHLVGGCVRDALLGRVPADIDVAVAGPPEPYAREAAKTLGGRLVIMGAPPEAVFRIVRPDRTLDVTGRMGESLRADLLRRDFTVNAMAWDVKGRCLVDPAGGQADLAKRRIHPTRPDAFARDPVRMVRALRFGAELDFALTPETRAGLRRHAFRVADPAGERIRTELHKLLATERAAPFLEIMVESGILSRLLPDMGADLDLGPFARLEAGFRASGTLPVEASRAARALGPEARRSTAYAALLRAPGGDGDAARTRLKTMAARLRWSGRETRRADDLLAHGDRLAAWGPAPGAPLERWRETPAAGRLFRALGADFPAVSLLHRAEGDPADAARAETVEGLLRHFRRVVSARLAEPPLLTGRDLAETLGLSPSPRFREILERSEIDRLRGAIRDRPAALAAARALLRQAASPDAPE